jgi:hypothetical protein
MKIQGLWYMMCHVGNSYQSFGGACCVHIQGLSRCVKAVQDRGSTLLQTISKYLPNKMMSYSMGLKSSSTLQ